MQNWLNKNKRISTPPTQPKLNEYPGASFGNRTRRFNASHFIKFPWLEYSIVRDKCFCNTCRHLGHENEQRISQIFTNLEIGFGDWKNMARSFEVHESSDYHQISSKAKIIYLNANANKDNDVINQLIKAKIKSIKENRYYLTAIIQSILFCARQELGLRGHDESKESENLGNFKELLHLISERDLEFKKIKQSLPENSKYTSPEIQNELIQIMSDQVIDSIIKQVKKAKPFLISIFD